MNWNAMNEALAGLCRKYAVSAGQIGPDAAGKPMLGGVPLVPWRVERRFVELKKIVDGGTLEGVSTLRFAAFQAGGDLAGILAEQLDLAEFLGGAEVRRVFAVLAPGDAACNAVLRLANGLSCCIEAGTALPAGSAPMDRHEIIARRGVASDRVVDSQVPQASIYEWTSAGARQWTDVDSELYGLENREIWTVRAAFEVLGHPGLGAVWRAAAGRMARWSAAALESAKSGQPVEA